MLDLKGLLHKTYYGRNLIMLVFVPGKPFQPSLVFLGKVRSLKGVAVG
jgi:hypothetical protein